MDEFLAIFYKGNNLYDFLVGFLYTKSLFKRSLIQKERIFSHREPILSFMSTLGIVPF